MTPGRGPRAAHGPGDEDDPPPARLLPVEDDAGIRRMLATGLRAARRLAVSTVGARARLEVDDAGPGIDPALRQEVFERFRRGASGDRGRDGGSGLGLALVARHVRRHGGTVEATERPGGGTRMVVELPVAPAAERG